MILQYMRCTPPHEGLPRAVDTSTTSLAVNLGADTTFQGFGDEIWRFEVDPGSGDVGVVFGSSSDVFADLAARNPFAASATPSGTNTGTDTLTFASATGWSTAAAVSVSATGGGLAAGTIYYYAAASATTGKLYDTRAHAIAGGGTGLIDLTSSITATLTGSDSRCERIQAGSGMEYTVRAGKATEQWFAVVASTGTPTLRYRRVSHKGNMSATTP